MSINANEKGSTAYAIEPYFLYKKRPSCKRGNATMVRRRLLSQPARGVLHTLGKYVTLHVLWGVMKSTRNSGYV